MFKKRRRSKAREAEAIALLIVVVIVFAIIGAIFRAISEVAVATVDFFGTTDGKAVVAVVVCVALGLLVKHVKSERVRKQKRAEESALEVQKLAKRQRAIDTISPSSNRDDYIIEKGDYRRGSPKENFYRKTFSLRLIEIFNNCCAKCQSKENGIDIDHFIFSKNEGGCFIMKHKDGYLVNNGIPLCQTCNRSKSDEYYKTFFTDLELLAVLEKNVLMTKLLNERNIFCDEGKIITKKKTATG